MFDEDDKDWVCEEVFHTGEDVFYIPRTNDMGWKQGLLLSTVLVEKYLSEGIFADKLKNYIVVGIDFVDGDIDILYRSV